MEDKNSVLVFLQFPLHALDYEEGVDKAFAIEDLLREAVNENNVGDFDGNEFCEDTVTFFIYGLDSSTIVEAILPILLRLPEMPGSYILKRSGNISQKQMIL